MAGVGGISDGASFGSQEEEARGTAMEQAESSAEVSTTDDACAGAGVMQGWWWFVYVQFEAGGGV